MTLVSISSQGSAFIQSDYALIIRKKRKLLFILEKNFQHIALYSFRFLKLFKCVLCDICIHKEFLFYASLCLF